MPELAYHSFVLRTPISIAAPVTTFFRWDDDPAEDAAFETYINKSANVNDATVDRSGAQPVLAWTESGTPHSEPAGPVGGHWHYSFRTPPASQSLVTHFSSTPDGYWECDQYGRPNDVNDLLA